MMAILMLGSSLRRSGQKRVLPATQVEPGVADKNGPGTKVVLPTTDPAPGLGIVLGEPLTPGVIPPRPVKYGTFAWRYPYSQRKVMYCLGIQSKVAEASQALNRSPQLSATKRDAVRVFLEPPPVVEHPAQECLLVRNDVARSILFISEARDSCAVFAPQVTCEGECHPVERLLRMVVVLDFDSVICVYARAAELAVARAQRIFAHPVVIEDQREPRLRTVQNLSAQSGPAAESAVGLPSVNDPGLNFQFVGGKPLDAQPIEKPGRVGGHIGGLVCPVVEVVITKEADV